MVVYDAAGRSRWHQLSISLLGLLRDLIDGEQVLVNVHE